jgi:hypothetical protein
MCNGANLAYTKSLFTALNGFDGIDGIASETGFIAKAIAYAPNTVHYLKAERYNCVYKTSN